MTPGDGFVELSADIGDDFPKADAHGGDVRIDRALLSCVTSVNVVCGEHAGCARSIRAVVEAATELGVRVGAHPSWPDDGAGGRGDWRGGGGLGGAGRLGDAGPLPHGRGSFGGLLASLDAQLRGFVALAGGLGVDVSHVKPHGGLYHAACADVGVAGVVLDAVRGCAGLGDGVALVGAAGSAGVRFWKDHGAVVLEEGFADRRYVRGGGLLDRREEGALIEDAEEAARQAVALALGEPVRTANGGEVVLRCSTICVHGDTPGSAVIARRVREALMGVGVLRVG